MKQDIQVAPPDRFARTIADWHRRFALRCVTVDEFAAWAGRTPETRVVDFQRNTFCGEAALRWCMDERAAGRCVLNAAQWAMRSSTTEEAA